MPADTVRRDVSRIASNDDNGQSGRCLHGPAEPCGLSHFMWSGAAKLHAARVVEARPTQASRPVSGRQGAREAIRQSRSTEVVMQSEPATQRRRISGGKTTTQSAEILPQLVRADAIAARTPWTRKHIYDLASRRQIPHHRFPDGSIAFDPIKVRAWIDEHEVAA